MAVTGRFRAIAATVLVVAAATVATACSGEDTYPLVPESSVKHGPPITTPEGAVVQLPLPPKRYDVSPGASCERRLATYHDGSKPTRRPIVVPPTPGLRADAVAERTVKVEWSFRSRPSDCRPERIAVGITASGDVRATPTVRRIDVTGDSGVATLTFPTFLAPPDIAFAEAMAESGATSRNVRVLIRR